MPKYKVTYHEVVRFTYTVEVEADSGDAAIDKAVEEYNTHGPPDDGVFLDAELDEGLESSDLVRE